MVSYCTWRDPNSDNYNKVCTQKSMRSKMMHEHLKNNMLTHEQTLTYEHAHTHTRT